MIIPKYIFFTKGKGEHKDKLISFELALRDAKIAPFNLVRVSSIFPPKCKVISPEEGLKKLKKGQILFCVLSENSTNKAGEIVSCSVGAAIPQNKNNYGYLSEHHDNKLNCGEYAQKLAVDMMKSVFKTDNIKSFYTSETSKGKKGKWVTVVAAAVLI